MSVAVRERSFRWDDPIETAAKLAGMPGIDGLRAVMTGAVPAPPIAALLGMDIVAVEPGRVVFRFEPAEYMYNPIGSVHGGIAATLLDSCMGCAVHTTLDAGVGYTTTDLQVRYLGGMTADTGPVLAEGVVVHAGRRVATAEGRLLVEDSGRVLAHATTGCLILRPD